MRDHARVAALTAMPNSGKRVLALEPLTSAAFRGYGQVIDRDVDAGAGHAINDGTAWRRSGLARVDAAAGGHPAISLVQAERRRLPFRLECLERHVLGSQAFVPLEGGRWIVVVAAGGGEPELEGLRAFLATPRQGVGYLRGTWHHPLIAIDRAAEFVVVDRIDDDDAQEDCELRSLATLDLWIDA